MTGRLPHKIAQLHERYGRAVRLLPDELSYNTPQAWNDIYGHRQGHQPLLKDKNWYQSVDYKGVKNIVDANQADHSRMRRTMSHAFSEKALREQESLVNAHVSMLISNLLSESGKPMNVSKW